MSYTDAVKNAVETIAADGVTITYPSGHTDTIETATLRAVRTGVSQATAAITDARMDEMNWDIILVSSHLGARVTDAEDYTNHSWWQGKFYSKSGKDPRFPPFDVCGMGNVQGIHGANCRHHHMPGDGEFNPFEDYDSEENRKQYELDQRQRALERRIRKTKRETMAAKTAMKNGDEATKAEMQKLYERKAALLQKQNKAYNDFCKDNGLKRLQDRLHVSGWNRSQASAASAAARKKQAVYSSEDLPNKSSTTLTNTSVEVNKMLAGYNLRDSKWSGNTIIKKAKSMPGAMGRKEWNCDITLREDAGFKTVVHEHLHARSISYYDEQTYIVHQKAEEATVELFAQEICRQNNIPFRPAYVEAVQKLQIINSITEHGSLFDFSKELFDISLPNRYSWLREKADNLIATNKLSAKTTDSLNEAVEYFAGKVEYSG